MKLSKIILPLISLFFLVSSGKEYIGEKIIVKSQDIEIKNVNIDINQNEEEKKDFTKYIGYGYDVTSGKSISEVDALMLNNPILNTSTDLVKNNTSVFDGSKTVYESNSSTSVSEIAESYGRLLSGGIDGKVAAISLDLGVRFNMDKTNGWTKTQTEEYSYFSIYAKNRPVVLQLELDEIRSSLSDNFKSELYSMNSGDKTAARNLFKKYGTHLLTGYTLGGIFEMTNYYATNSSNYNRQNTTSFAGQVQAGISAASVGGDFSFTESFAMNDNNSYAVNNYKCTTYGGLTFPGLTIEQAFTVYNSSLESKYVYQIWTDSINKGENLVIVDIPQSSKMIPLWNLLPGTQDYADARELLLDTYIDMCGGVYRDYVDNHNDIFVTDKINENIRETEETLVEVSGYNYYAPLSDEELNTKMVGNFVSTYIDASDKNSTNRVVPGSIISFDFDDSKLLGIDYKWKISAAATNYAEVLDDRLGIIQFKTVETSNPKRIDISLVVGSKTVFATALELNQTAFKGGDGSNYSPYLIYDKKDFIQLFKTELWGMSFKLMNDIDLSGTQCSVIGNSLKPYSGIFDGNHHTIKNCELSYQQIDKSIGLFGNSSGTIKNLQVDSFTIKNSNVDYLNEVTYIGTLCAKNIGTIDNCHANNINLFFKRNGVKVAENMIGGLVGSNLGGIVSKCSINKSKIDIQVDYNEFTSNTIDRSLSVGGIIGHCQTSKKIVGCLVDNVSIKASLGSKKDLDTSKNRMCMVGGIVGNLMDGTISNCLVKNINKSYESSSSFIAQLGGKYTNPTSNNIKACCGGIVGFVDKDNTYLEKCVIENSISIFSLLPNTTFSLDVKNLYENGLVAGFLATKNESAIIDNLNECHIILVDLTNVASKITDISDLAKETYCLFTSNRYIEDKYQYMFISPSSYTYSSSYFGSKISSYNLNEYNVTSLRSALNNSEIWDENSKSLEIKYNNIIKDDIVFDLEGAKRTFFINESFKLGNVTASTFDTDGNAVNISVIEVDSSTFDSSTPGTYLITLTAYGVSETYTVDVIDPSLTGLYVDEVDGKPINEQYEGEQFNPEGMIVTACFEDGKTKKLAYEGLKDNPNYAGYDGYYSIKNIDNILTPGSNGILITYEGLEYTYYINAEEKEVKNITICKEPALNVYDVGTNILLTDDLEIKVEYGNGNVLEEIKTGKDCEFFHSTIIFGKNKVIVSYDEYYTDSFEVRGEFLTVDQKVINDFIFKVYSYDDLVKLEDKYNLIIECKNLKSQIRKDYTSEAYDNAVLKLNEIIEDYNRIIDEINNGFEDSTAIIYQMDVTIINGVFNYESIVIRKK